MKRKVNDGAVRNRDKKYKEKAKKYHDSKNMKKSHLRLGDRVLMKDRRTDRLRPEIAVVIETTDHSVTMRFENGKILTRDKSHVKVINQAVVPSSRERPKKKNTDEEQKRYELYDADESDEEESEEETTLKTKSGRQIKKPVRYGEWTTCILCLSMLSIL